MGLGVSVWNGDVPCQSFAPGPLMKCGSIRSFAILSYQTDRFFDSWYLRHYYYLAHQHKAAGRKTRLDIQNYGCNGSLLCYHGVMERNRISSLQSHGKALEKECCLPGEFRDSGDTPANLLCELNCSVLLLHMDRL